MKKLIIAAAMMACAIVANASSVSWGATAALDSEKITAGTMYLMASSTGTFDASKLSGQTAFTLAVLEAAGLDMTFDSFDYSGSKINVTGSKFNASTLGYTAGQYTSVYAICIETGDDADYMAYSTKMTVTLNNNTSPTQSKILAPSSFTYVQTKGTTPIPEPTSGILVLLGFAGLALRRKQK